MPEAARELAARLAELFGRGHELVLAINTAQPPARSQRPPHRRPLSQRVAQRLRPKGPTSASRPPTARPEDEQPIAALEDVTDTIRHAFTEYRGVAEQRRQLGFDVGEANASLIAALTSAGFTEAEARRADVDGGKMASGSR